MRRSAGRRSAGKQRRERCGRQDDPALASGCLLLVRRGGGDLPERGGSGDERAHERVERVVAAAEQLLVPVDIEAGQCRGERVDETGEAGRAGRALVRPVRQRPPLQRPTVRTPARLPRPAVRVTGPCAGRTPPPAPRPSRSTPPPRRGTWRERRRAQERECLAPSSPRRRAPTGPPTAPGHPGRADQADGGHARRPTGSPGGRPRRGPGAPHRGPHPTPHAHLPVVPPLRGSGDRHGGRQDGRAPRCRDRSMSLQHRRDQACDTGDREGLTPARLNRCGL